MAKALRWAFDSTCFTAWVDRKETEDQNYLRAIDVAIKEMVEGKRRIVATQAIEIEVRPDAFLRDVKACDEFHRVLRACPHFESFGVNPSIRASAKSLADRLLASGGRGGYADLIHVATAIAARATELWTTDKKVIRWHTEGAIPELKICAPHLDQDELDLDF